MEPMIPSMSHALSVTMLLSPHEKRMTDQLLPRIARFIDVEQHSARGRERAHCTSSNLVLSGHNPCNGRACRFPMRALDCQGALTEICRR